MQFAVRCSPAPANSVVPRRGAGNARGTIDHLPVFARRQIRQDLRQRVSRGRARSHNAPARYWAPAGRDRRRPHCSDSAIAAAESISVPSQSKTSSSNGAGMRFRFRPAGRGLPRTGAVPVAAALRWSPRPAQRMADDHPMRMQEHPFQALLRQYLVQGEIAVLVVAQYRKPEMREVHADLVGAPGFQFRIEQTVRADGDVPAGIWSRPHRPRCRRLRGALPMPARISPAEIRPPACVRSICPSPARNSVFRFRRPAAGGAAPPVPRAFGEHQHAGGLAVEPVSRTPGTSPPGATWRKASITPKLTPLPPCTAMPAGLSITSRASSSYSTSSARPRPGARTPPAARRPPVAARHQLQFADPVRRMQTFIADRQPSIQTEARLPVSPRPRRCTDPCALAQDTP